jgi:hypothetical protein
MTWISHDCDVADSRPVKEITVPTLVSGEDCAPESERLPSGSLDFRTINETCQDGINRDDDIFILFTEGVRDEIFASFSDGAADDQLKADVQQTPSVCNSSTTDHLFDDLEPSDLVGNKRSTSLRDHEEEFEDCEAPKEISVSSEKLGRSEPAFPITHSPFRSAHSSKTKRALFSRDSADRETSSTNRSFGKDSVSELDASEANNSTPFVPSSYDVGSQSSSSSCYWSFEPRYMRSFDRYEAMNAAQDECSSAMSASARAESPCHTRQGSGVDFLDCGGAVFTSDADENQSAVSEDYSSRASSNQADSVTFLPVDDPNTSILQSVEELAREGSAAVLSLLASFHS